MTVTCQCGRPAHEAFVCGTCVARCRADLQAVPSLAAELDTTLTRQTAGTPRNGGRSADTPLPYDLPASEAAWILRNTLGGWARVLGEEMALAGPGRPLETISGQSGYTRQGSEIDTAEIATWLAAHVDHIRRHPAAGEAIDEIREAIRQARHAIDLPATRARFHVGPCPEDDCPGQVRAVIPAEKPAYMDCGNGHRWETWQWLRAGKRILDRAANT